MGSDTDTNSLSPRVGNFSKARVTHPKMWKTQSTKDHPSLNFSNLIAWRQQKLNGQWQVIGELKLPEMVWLKRSFPAPYVKFGPVLFC